MPSNGAIFDGIRFTGEPVNAPDFGAIVDASAASAHLIAERRIAWTRELDQRAARARPRATQPFKSRSLRRCQ